MRSRKDKGHYGRPWLRMRAEVFASEAVCFICGQWVDKTLNWRDPGAPQLHLKIPLSRGGSWRDRQNATLAHRSCNIRQGNRLPGETVTLPSGTDQTYWVAGEEP